MSHRPPLNLRIWAQALLAFAILIATVIAGPVKAAPLDQAMATIFTVHTADNEDRFLGSAFLWGTGEVAVTNAHVVGNATEVRLKDATGQEEIATVIASDPTRDVAVISVKPGRVGLIPSTDAPRLGAEVWAFGAPLGIEFTVTEGRISALQRQVEAAVPIRMIQHDAAVNPGSSGGPLVDDTGALVGMNSQIADGSRMFVGIAYAIPAADLDRIVVGLIAETLPPLPKLGMIARPVDRQLADALGISVTGLLVDQVTQGELADRAGVKPGDVVLAIGDTPLTQPGDLAFALEAAQSGDSLDITVLRAGAVLVLMTALDAPAETHLTLRDISSAPARISSYTLASLGLTLGSQGRISAINENSPALFAGVARGDRIVMLNGQPLSDLDLSTISFDGPVLLLLQDVNGTTRHVLIDPWATGKTIRPVGGANVLDPNVVLF
jgi:serine protease Do